jgi:EAL domain-containing protein (putative c-di-GMP-specific phosphodiesterase class I)
LATLDRTGANPRRLKLELTESLLIVNVDDVIAKMNTLRALGVQFSLDDFGTGYSSLAYLSRLPFDQVKIDRSFVMNIESSDDSVAICAAIVSLGHSLKLKVVAEGVETEAQRYFLSTVHRCDYLQGYLFSRPLPIEHFETYESGQAPAVR